MNPFITPTSNAGIPPHFCLAPPTGDQNILNIKPKLLTKLFFMLHTIDIQFEYTFNNSHYHNSLSLHDPTPPLQRLNHGPSLHTDKSTHNSLSFAHFSFSQVYHSNNSYHLNFTLQQQDLYQDHLLSTSLNPNLTLIDSYQTTLFNHPLTLYLLSHLPNPSGYISSASFHESYFKIKNTPK